MAQRNSTGLSAAFCAGLGALLLLSCATISHADAPFVIQTVDGSSNDLGRFLSLDLDSRDRPRVFYAKGGNQLGASELRYANRTRNGWVQEVVVQGIQMVLPSLVLGTQDQPHLLYFQIGSYNVYYLRKISGAWVSEGVVFCAVGGACALALDAADAPHVCYTRISAPEPDAACHDTRYSLSYKKRSVSGTWTSEFVYSRGGGAGCGGFTDLAIAVAPDGSPRIAFRDSGLEDLLYATRGAAWTVELVDGAGGRQDGKGLSLKLDPSGNAHISYFDGDTGELKYARKQNAAWSIETVQGTFGAAGSSSSIDVDALGNPHVSFHSAPSGDLMYARRIGGSWIVSRVDGAAANVGSANRLMLDSAGAPQIAYYDVSQGVPKFAFLRPAIAIPEDEEDAGGLASAPDSQPSRSTLIFVIPNPSSARHVTVRLASDLAMSRAEVRVYDASGRFIRSLRRAGTSDPMADLHWDGRDATGVNVPAGIYFLHAENLAVSATAKVSILR